MNLCDEVECCRMDPACPSYSECHVAEQDSGPIPPELCGSCDAGLPMSCTCPPAGEQSFTATRAELLDALTHLKADLPWPPPIRRDGTIALNAESMADAIIEALARRQRHVVHFHWPPRCGFASVPAGDTWSGNLGDVTCSACLRPPEPAPKEG